MTEDEFFNEETVPSDVECEDCKEEGEVRIIHCSDGVDIYCCRTCSEFWMVTSH